MASNSWVSLPMQWFKMLWLQLESTESLELHLMWHVCSKRVQFNNPLVMPVQEWEAQSQAQLVKSILFLFSSITLMQVHVGPFSETEKVREGRGFTWIIFLFWFSQITTASTHQRRPQTIDWEPKWIAKAGMGRNQTSFATKDKTGCNYTLSSMASFISTDFVRLGIVSLPAGSRKPEPTPSCGLWLMWQKCTHVHTWCG